MQFMPIYSRTEQARESTEKTWNRHLEREFKIFQINLDFEMDSLRPKFPWIKISHTDQKLYKKRWKIRNCVSWHNSYKIQMCQYHQKDGNISLKVETPLGQTILSTLITPLKHQYQNTIKRWKHQSIQILGKIIT